ncbi:MAG: phosphodiester glycosidase family protein [Spirulina sp. SIO3F2]|nr:phosphodiester glycosidase family protein [Spirulina sp. SIO3F2]
MVMILTLSPLILYASLVFRRPPRTPLKQPLFEGVTYHRQVRNQPRPIMIHIVSVDLTNPGVEVMVSPGMATSDAPNQTLAQTTSRFLQAAQVQIASNGSFFYPFREKTPWDYAPHVGDRANVLGLAIASEETYAEPRYPWHPVCFLKPQRAIISPHTACPVGTQFALSAGPRLLTQGQPTQRDPVSSEDKPYARLLLALDQAGTRLWLIAIDGKQPFYSEGMTLTEATELLQDLGAYDALNLDGGGSTTLVQSANGQPRFLNAPVHAKLPMWERPVANQIGIRAWPLAD